MSRLAFGFICLVFRLYNERPILGDNPKAHKILLKSAALFTEKHNAFHGVAVFTEKRNERPFARNCNPMFFILEILPWGELYDLPIESF